MPMPRGTDTMNDKPEQDQRDKVEATEDRVEAGAPPATEPKGASDAGASARVAQAQEQAVGSMAPTPAEPLQPNVVAAAQSAISSAIQSLGGGELEAPQMPPHDPGMGGGLNAETYATLTFLGQTMQELAKMGVPNAERFVFDPDEAAQSNQGLADATRLLETAANDQGLVQALQGAMQQQAPAEPEAQAQPPAPEKEEPDYEALAT